jgi:hypothetical protein
MLNQNIILILICCCIFYQQAFLTVPYHVRLPSAAFLRSEGKCPLAPEEAVLMLAAIGFKRSTNIYIAGAEIYGGRHRMAAISHLYPALVTKETLLSPSELEPFRNFSSQVNVIDNISMQNVY